MNKLPDTNFKKCMIINYFLNPEKTTDCHKTNIYLTPLYVFPDVPPPRKKQESKEVCKIIKPSRYVTPMAYYGYDKEETK
jgi:hypothetical protein